MTGGYSDEWWMLLLIPVMLWVPLGPFVMGALGTWCALRPGWRPRLLSVLLPLEPAGFPVILQLRDPTPSDPIWRDDFLGTIYVCVLGVTVLPWLLGYGITRGTRARRSKE